MSVSTFKARSSIPRIDIKVRGARVPGDSMIGEAAEAYAGVVIALGLALLEQWSLQSLLKEKIEGQIEDLEPEIQKKMDGLAADIAKLQLKTDKGEKVYANITIDIRTWESCISSKNECWPDGEALLFDIDISTKNIKQERKGKTKCLNRTTRYTDLFDCDFDRQTFSTEVWVYTEEELETFRDLEYEYLDYKLKLRRDPSNQVWFEETNRLRDRIVQAYGNDVWFLQSEFLPYS
jgi:hypothetical protein